MIFAVFVDVLLTTLFCTLWRND